MQNTLPLAMDKLLRILLWVVVVAAPGGLLLLPVLAYRLVRPSREARKARDRGFRETRPLWGPATTPVPRDMHAWVGSCPESLDSGD